ncbi:hypothetical protein Mapa_014858 [Marchantia paleacea]|nr:hypothetical protein Mapa_014858 [Marchantia paleacea]
MLPLPVLHPATTTKLKISPQSESRAQLIPNVIPPRPPPRRTAAAASKQSIER